MNKNILVITCLSVALLGLAVGLVMVLVMRPSELEEQDRAEDREDITVRANRNQESKSSVYESDTPEGRSARIAETDLETLKSECDAYHQQLGAYPTKLDHLWVKPANLPEPDKWSQFRTDPISPDPWGNRYRYTHDVNSRTIVIASAGADGRYDSIDDISVTSRASPSN